MLLWENGKESKETREKAAEHFMISAKLNPQNGPTFRYLGHYYSRVSIDHQRALKCYQRAVTLNPDDSESGVSFNSSRVLLLKILIFASTSPVMCALFDTRRKHCVICWMKEERRASRFLSAGKLLRNRQGPFGLSEDWDTFRSLSSSSVSFIFFSLGVPVLFITFC